MNSSFLPSRGVSLENIAEEEGDAPGSSRMSSSSTSYARTLGTPQSTRRNYRRAGVNSSFISSRLGSFDEPENELTTGAVSPLAGADEWEFSRMDVNVPPHFTMADIDLSPTGLEKRMRDLLTDSKFWIRLVDRLGYDRKVFDSTTSPSLDQLSRYFDSSDLGLLRVFHVFDSNKDRLMSKEEMISGLVQHGLVEDAHAPVARAACDELFDLCSGNSDSVSPLQFLLALKSLRLAAILHPFSLLAETRRNAVASRELDLFFHGYKEDQITISHPVTDPVDFLFTIPEMPPEHSQSRVHWIHCHEPSKRAVLALAVQLGLDPRYVLDVFTLWREQAKADRVRDLHSIGVIPPPEFHQSASEWVFMVVPVVRLTAASKAAIEPYFRWRRDRQHENRPPIHIEVESCNMAIFVTGRSGRGTAVTFTSEWVGICRLDLDHSDVPVSASKKEAALLKHNRKLESNKGGLVRGDGSMSFDGVADGAVGGAEAGPVDLEMFAKVVKVLDTSYSHLRTGDAFTLVLKAISDCCEDYVKITDAYDAAIDLLSRKLRKERDKLSQADVRQIQRSARHLSQLHRAVRPVTGIIEILSQQQWGGESALYISDLESNVSKFMGDSAALIESAELLRKQHQQMGQARTGSVLYVLMLVTTIFAPAEFAATLYGMNFKDKADKSQPGMPELKWRLGYLFFWGVVLAMVSVIFTFYKKKNWI